MIYFRSPRAHESTVFRRLAVPLDLRAGAWQWQVLKEQGNYDWKKKHVVPRAEPQWHAVMTNANRDQAIHTHTHSLSLSLSRSPNYECVLQSVSSVARHEYWNQSRPTAIRTRLVQSRFTWSTKFSFRNNENYSTSGVFDFTRLPEMIVLFFFF